MSSNRKLIIFVEIFSNFILLPETFVWFSCVHKKYLSLFLQDYPSCFPLIVVLFYKLAEANSNTSFE